jgi:hypothetical protein
MKKFRLFGAAVMAASMIGVMAAHPVAATYFTYTTGFQIQNLESSAATVTIVFYNPNTSGGSAAATISNDSIAASSSKTYFPLTAVASGFNGSAVVSSDKQVAAVVNVLGNNGVSSASYIGFSGGSTSLSIPLLMKGNYGFNTWFKVQNAGTGNASVTVTYTDGTTASATIQEGASATFDQATEAHNSAVFAGKITSDKPVVATIMEEDAATLFAYNAFTNGSTNPVMPLINANNYGILTGVQIQNAGSSATDVTVSYTPSTNGTACTETQNIPAGQSRTYALNAFASSNSGENCANGATFVGSARVTTNSSSQPLAVIVNQLKPAPSGFGESYDGFDPSTATNAIVMPLIMDRNYGFFTGFSVMNVGASSTTVNCAFTNSSYTESATLAPGSALTALQLNKLANGYVGSATCTAGSGAKIVGVVNELNENPGSDSLLVYEAISK